MSARHLLLLPAAVVLSTLTACDATAGRDPSPTTSSAAAADDADRTAPADTTEATGGAEKADCPSEATLQKLVELPKGYTLGNVQCVKDWAAADPQGDNVGSGGYLFHYQAGTGWKYYGQGSGYDCKDLGLNEPAPFCISGP